METTNNLYQKLWSASDDLRNFMDANEYKNFLFNLLPNTWFIFLISY